MTPTQAITRHVVGVMTGTSIDGIDAALVRVCGYGLEMRADLVRHLSKPLGNIGTRLRAAAEQKPMTAGEFASLAWEFGQLHAQVIEELLASSGAAPKHPHPSPLPQREREFGPDLICVHGQTVFHQPPISWQLVNPAPIAQRFRCPVVFDLRQADLAAGGQGAPITPIADWVLFRDPNKRRAIVNLGGFCNVTILPAQRAGTSSCRSISELSEIRGFDVCACNQILDAVARATMGNPFDEDGAAAMRGCAKPQAADTLLRVLNSQRAGKRSLGTGDESLHWVESQITNGLSSNDLAASAVDAVARCIGTAVAEHRVDEIIVAGGGARNAALIDALERTANMPTHLSVSLGVPIEARESIAFAILGALCADGIPITLPHVTGCKEPSPISGSWCSPSHSCGMPPRG